MVAVISAKYDVYSSVNTSSMKPHTCWLRISILLIYIFIGPSHPVCNHLNNSLEKHNGSAKSSAFPCQNVQQVQVKFITKIVKNEYIVAFKGYYKPHTRANYIKAALNSSGIKNWKILPRDNLASSFPSDFDVVLLEETTKYNGLNALNDHPLIKRVTPQKLVHRNLKFINTTSDDFDLPEFRNFRRKISNNVSFLNYIKILVKKK